VVALAWALRGRPPAVATIAAEGTAESPDPVTNPGGLLAVSAGPAAAARERAGYVRSLRAADRGEGPWY
jgi:hypothetical protein